MMNIIAERAPIFFVFLCKKALLHIYFFYFGSFLWSFLMTTNRVQTSSNQMKTILTTDEKSKKKPDTNAVIHQRPSTMDDTKDCLFKANEKKNNSLLNIEPDLKEEDRFRASFIDCSCDCSVSFSNSICFSRISKKTEFTDVFRRRK